NRALTAQDAVENFRYTPYTNFSVYLDACV
ncbi:MAG: hypothetical protein ACI97Y_000412, partial [Pseudomonadales bacterium]